MELGGLTILGCFFYYAFLLSIHKSIDQAPDILVMIYMSACVLGFFGLMFCGLLTMGSYGLLPIYFASMLAMVQIEKWES